MKPENIFITSDGRVKILDFGLAKLTQNEPPQAGATALPTMPANTQPGVVLGTIGYMSPEQVRGDRADHRADIFALGLILYEMLSGRRAFSGETSVETMHAILTVDPSELVTPESGIPLSLDQLVRFCLEKNPKDRLQSARDLALALENRFGTIGVEPEAARRGDEATVWPCCRGGGAAGLGGHYVRGRPLVAPRRRTGSV